MYRFIIAGCLVAGVGLFLSFGPLQGQDQPEENAEPAKENAPEITSTADKVSYGIGQNIGADLAKNGIELNEKVFLLGLRDALAKREPRVSSDEMVAAMEEFFKELEAKRAASQKEYLVENGKKKGVTTLKSGLQYEVLQKGDGPSPKKTDTVRTLYEGTLIDGTVFDSSVNPAEPATFGVNKVIKGWTEALQLMKVGDKWRIVVPAELAYGSRGAGQTIGPNATLVFEIELLGIEKAE
ncbi:MAG: FKBP-type peptidyl-prolyl cis-trans isomerase [Planctomycetaceae bacterium]